MTGWTAKIYGHLPHPLIFYLKEKKSKFQKHKQMKTLLKRSFSHDVTAAILQYKTMNMLAKQQTKKSCRGLNSFLMQNVLLFQEIGNRF